MSHDFLTIDEDLEIHDALIRELGGAPGFRDEDESDTVPLRPYSDSSSPLPISSTILARVSTITLGLSLYSGVGHHS